MRDDFDTYMNEWAEPLPPDPRPVPESVPMEKTVVVDFVGEAEKPKTYLDEGDKPAFKKRQEEGFSMAPPVDIYEPGFRSDVYAAIKRYFLDKKATQNRIQAIREKTGIGRNRTWTPGGNS